MVYVVHNFKELQTVESVEQRIKKDIENCFNVQRKHFKSSVGNKIGRFYVDIGGEV